MQDKKECYITGVTHGLHKHHVFGAANRDNSERFGLTVWLIPELHNLSERGVHCNKEMMDLLHRAGQLAFERVHGTRQQFIEIFGQDYIGDTYDFN